MKPHRSLSELTTCPACHRKYKNIDMFPGASIRPVLQHSIQETNPDWKTTDDICSNCLRQARLDMIEQMLIDEKGEIGKAEREVLDAVSNQEFITTKLAASDEQITFGTRLSDKIADIGGSWKFIIFFMISLFLWVFINSVMFLNRSFDPYPYIFLNLILSCLAALQAPVIMMSQNRKEEKDRARSESDYKTNLKAELEIRHLHIKLDQLSTHQWHQLIEIQQMQLDVLEDIKMKKQ